jgi:hypothetical protein
LCSRDYRCVITDVCYHAWLVCWDRNSLTVFAWADLEWWSSWSLPPE